MDSIVIRLIDKNEPDLAEEVKGELIGAEYAIVYEGEAELVGVDATKHGDGEQVYGPAFVLVGAK
ncbi:MAG: hypothetical protein JSU70_16125 [Phycisphaerales bacterium]|nr:MAG: hypothetical protein JSU70_16125 [Phycisphaerales bacterium]